MCMGVEKIFSRGPLVNFSKSSSRGARSGEICFLPLETKKNISAEIFKVLPPSDTHACV